jgi:hypothetical protein
MPAEPSFTPQEQFQALNTLDFLSDLISAGKEEFSRVDVLMLIEFVKQELFDLEVVIAQQTATRGLEDESTGSAVPELFSKLLQCPCVALPSHQPGYIQWTCPGCGRACSLNAGDGV